MARKKKHEEHVNHERWLVSYADFITLLFAFFVVMFAVSQVDSNKVGRFVESVNDAFHHPAIFQSGSPRVIAFDQGWGSNWADVVTVELPLSTLPEFQGYESANEGYDDDEPGEGKGKGEGEGEGEGEGKGEGEGEGEGPGKGEGQGEGEGEGDGEGKGAGQGEGEGAGLGEDGTEVVALPEALRKLAADELLAGKISVRAETRGSVISLSELGFFGSASTELKQDAVPLLERVAETVRDANVPVRIEGHADNRPLRDTTRYPSNWELSAGRALTVLHHFESQLGLDGRRLSAGVFGEHAPIATNDTPEGRGRNRRVDIVLLSRRAASLEPGPLDLAADRTEGGS